MRGFKATAVDFHNLWKIEPLLKAAFLTQPEVLHSLRASKHEANMGVCLVIWELNRLKANYDEARLNLSNHLSCYSYAKVHGLLRLLHRSPNHRRRNL
jgi:hypothetical protein